MTTKQKFKSDAFAAIHASATALQKVGAIDQTTMRQFDETCLAVPTALEPTQTKQPPASVGGCLVCDLNLAFTNGES